MSLIKFELKEEHLKLLKFLHFSNKEGTSSPVISEELFGTSDIIDDVYLILYGKKEDESIDANPWDDLPPKYSEEEIKFMEELLSELPLAMEIVLFTQSFELGWYKTPTYVRDWKKIK